MFFVRKKKIRPKKKNTPAKIFYVPNNLLRTHDFFFRGRNLIRRKKVLHLHVFFAPQKTTLPDTDLTHANISQARRLSLHAQEGFSTQALVTALMFFHLRSIFPLEDFLPNLPLEEILKLERPNKNT